MYSRNFLDFAKTGLQKARQLGADSAELFIVKNRSLEVEMKEGDCPIIASYKFSLGYCLLCLGNCSSGSASLYLLFAIACTTILSKAVLRNAAMG